MKPFILDNSIPHIAFMLIVDNKYYMTTLGFFF